MPRKNVKKKKWDSPEGFLDWLEQWDGLKRFAKTFRPAALWTLSILIVLVIFLLGRSYVNRMLYVPVDKKSTVMVVFDIYRGDSLSVVSRRLEEQDLIRNRMAFKLYSDFANKSDSLQAGRYYISPYMTMEQILDIFTLGPDRAGTVRVTLAEGMTVQEMVEAFRGKGLLVSEEDKQKFLTIVKKAEGFTDYSAIKALEKKDQRINIMEGYLFPDTYEFYLTATPEEIAEKLIKQFNRVFDDSMKAKAKKLGLSMDEVITIASIIEREGKEEDFYKVSAVIHNRLDKGMKLDMDSTVKYVTGSKKMIIDDQINTDSPYNTYLYKGLPPGPICNPGRSAIMAALNPDAKYVEEGYLYFTTKDPTNGSLEFSRTAAEHNAAVAKYRPLWAEYDRKNENN